MLEIKDLKIEIDNKIIIDHLDMVVNSGDKMAIIGEEGNGKSTLLKAIISDGNLDYAHVTGTINYKGYSLGYLEQTLNSKYLDNTVKEYLFKNNEEYYFKLHDLYYLINILGLKEEILDSIIKLLSGGEKVKMQLLKILLQDPDLLLLDEPTNDLDIETLEWLESYINTSKQPIIYVSHDETLLSKTANMILHLELTEKKQVPRHTVIKSTYDAYVGKRIRSLAKQTQVARKEQDQYKKQTEKLNQIMSRVESDLNSISRSDPHGARMLAKKMKSLKSQEKRFENKELTKIPDYEEAITCFFESTNLHHQKEVLKLDLNVLKVEDKILATNISLEVIGPRHIAIIGKNGVGKTTLIKLIYQLLSKRDDLNVGYMPQNYDDILEQYNNPLDFLMLTGDKDEMALIRSYMGNMNFTREEMMGSINNLSGGSKAKLFILKLILNECNVLILDEPTRNVSPLSNPVIRNVLNNYDGAIISISHDRKYINEVADTVYELTKEGLKKRS